MFYWIDDNNEPNRSMNWQIGYPQYHDILRVTYKGMVTKDYKTLNLIWTTKAKFLTSILIRF